LLEEVGDSATRLTFDRGLLEITVPSRHHERVKKFVGQIAETSLKILGIRYEPAGSATWRREDQLRGLEADECYHIQHAAQVKGKMELDLTRDPPPDLAIEVDLTSSSINKMEIYATLRIPELWWIEPNGQCQMLLLRDDDGTYQPSDRSVCLPMLTAVTVSHYLLLHAQLGHSDAIRMFEAEVLSTWKE
jgi:Uma2 family endonuclease